MCKVSVIMPSLNVAKYITECMGSVLNQSLQDIEVLAIDAGSTDGTLEILQEYACKDARVRVIVSDKKSYGYQVNLGISLARGEYIGIVETDDLIVSDMYETLYYKAKAVEADYVKGTAKAFVMLPNGFIWQKPIARVFGNSNRYNTLVCACEEPELLLRDIYLWTGIYRKDFLHDIRLNESAGAAFQDQGFLFQTISNAKRAVYLDHDVYLYRQDNSNSSIMNSKGFSYLVGEYQYVEQFLQGKKCEWYGVYFRRLFAQCMGRFRTMAVSGHFWDGAEGDIEILRKRLLYAVKNNYLQASDMDDHQWKMLELFLQGAEQIYSYCMGVYKQKVSVVQQVFKQIDNNKVVIFGSGNYGKFFHALLASKYYGHDVVFCDNNSKLWNTDIQGVRVLSPEEAVKQFVEAVYVVANLRNVDAIKEQLKRLGIPEERICVYQEEPYMLLFHM